MRLQILAGVLALWCAIGHATQQQSSFVIIVNKGNPVKTLTIVELRRIFMKQSRMWLHAEPMVPVDWDGTSPIREMFSRQVLNRSVREMAEYWVQQSMTQGIAPPSTQRSARAVLRFVASVPGAISYLPIAEADDTVHVIKVIGLSRATEGESD
jgi:ABC-type phosphate transport system substrate-binding protein